MKKVYSLLILATFMVTIFSCAKREDKVVAKIKKEKITIGDFEERFGERRFETEEEELAEKNKVLDEMIGDKLMVLEAKTRGYDRDEELLKDIENKEKDIAVRHLYKVVVLDKAKVSEGEIKRHYDRLNKEVKARDILVETKREAREILKEINEGGKFEELAKERSTNKRTAAKGGDLGYFTWNKFPENFSKAVFSMKVDEVKIVEDNRGFHIVKVEDIREGKMGEFKTERVKIEQRLLFNKRTKLANEFLDGLKKKARISFDEEFLNLLAKKTPKEKKRPFGSPPLPTLTDDEKARILVKFNKKEWSCGEVLDRFGRGTPQFDKPDVIKRAVENLIVTELLQKEAYKRRLHRAQEVKQKLNQTVERIILNRIRKEEITDKARATDEEIKKYFEDNRDKYKENEKAKAQMILVKIEEEANDIVKKLRKGTKFEKLAKDKSTHYTRNRGGDLGLFERGRYPDIEDVAFSIRIGKISDPIKTKDGYAIIKVTERKPERLKEFDKVKRSVKKDLDDELRKKRKTDLIESLKGKYTVEINQENLRIAGKKAGKKEEME